MLESKALSGTSLSSSRGRLIAAAILINVLYGMITALLGTILPALSTRFHLSPEENGSAALAQALGMIVASLAAGVLIDYRGTKTGLVLGLATMVGSLLLLAKAKDAAGIKLSLALLGFGGGIQVTAGNAFVNLISEKLRATLFNLALMFFGLGAMATPFIAANFLTHDPERLAYVAAVLGCLTLVVVATLRIPAAGGERGFRFAGARALAARPLLWLLALLLALYISCEFGIWNWLTRELIAQGMPESQAQNILSLGFALGLMLGRLLMARLLVTLPPDRVILGSAVAMTVTTACMLAVHSAANAWITVFCAGLAMAAVFPTALALVGDLFPNMTATALGIVITSGWVGLAISSRLIGAIAGDDPARLKTALIIIPVSSAVIAIIVAAIRPAIASHRHVNPLSAMKQEA